ncbi:MULTISPECIES: STAS domain-containing protein [Thermocrispum]|jgi:anti-anti-sigma factor|uniref:Anti-sigma factor antagonist n=1 Tax=Thermocrispum agreste TaxID=37925 RepID=A0ABD6FG96_9PSEU|nr:MULTISPECIES: STAS domain-containing protein [Thermocrispum]
MSVSSSTPGPASSAGDVTVRVDRRDSAAVLRVTGEIDMSTADRLTAGLDDALRDQPSVVVVDLQGVRFFASAGVSALVAARDTVGERTRFAVVVKGNAVLRSLRLSGADLDLPRYDSVDAALADA